MDDPGPGNFITQYLTLAASGDHTSAGSLVLKLILLLVLVLVNAFFAMSEIAIISLNDAKIERMAEDGHKKAKQLVKLTKNSNRFLSTIQIGVTLAGFLTSASAATNFADMLTTAVTNAWDVPVSVVSHISVILITIIMSYFSLVLGELAPKRIAMQAPEKVSFAVVGVLLFISKIAAPFVKILSVSTNFVVKLLGFDPNADEEVVTEEEIRMMVDVGEEKGVIENTQKEMINNIFEFDDLDAGDIMTHRTDVVAVNVNDTTLEDFINLSTKEGFSRIPMYEDDIDNIIGIIHVKDLLQFVGKQVSTKQTLRSILREPYFIPESKACGELFTEMSAHHIQMAIVVDEYGGTAGLLTLEDIVEAIMGNIQDEYDDEDEEISKIDDRTFTVDGTIDIEEIDELIGKKLPDGDYETLAGFIIDNLQYIPKDGEMNEVTFENVKFTVLKVEDRRIEKIKVEIFPPEEPEDDEKAPKEKAFKEKEKAQKEDD
ncbi:MAG: hemolysin family protein [Oscillospiraceae bacterium]|nr:hemolysin family protein [Oscillospiraceae bacterium]